MGDQSLTKADFEGFSETITTALTALTEQMTLLTNEIRNGNNNANQQRGNNADRKRDREGERVEVNEKMTEEAKFSCETTWTKEGNGAQTRVYWDIDDFPIPDDINPEKYCEIIKSSIANAGFHGEVSIWAYIEKMTAALYFDYYHAGIILRDKGSEVPFADIDNMLVEILVWSMQNRWEEPLNLLVISKNTELFGVLQDLASEKENYNIFVIDLDEDEAGSFSLSPIPFLEGNAIDQSRSSPGKTAVFWNMEDCPIPEGLDPDKMYQNVVKSALANQDFHGDVSITAYCEKIDLSLAGVTMVPAGDESSRFKKMLRDILFWALRNPVHYPKTVSTLMVISSISRSSKFAHVFQSLRSRGFNVLLALPDAVEYVSWFWLYPSSFWLYPCLSNDLPNRRSVQRLTLQSKSHGLANKGKKIQKQSKSQAKKLWKLHGVGNKGKKIQKQSKSEHWRNVKKASKLYQKKKKAKIGIFWNMDDCQISVCHGQDSVYRNIEFALGDQGYHGDMSIMAYRDKRHGFGHWSYMFSPVKNRVSEDEDFAVEVDNMFVDMVLWALDNPAPSNFVVISENISGETELSSLLQALERKGYNILLPNAKAILCGEEPNFQDVPNEVNTIQMKSSSKRHGIFWNIENCPIPGGLDPRTFLQNIKLALANHGWHGDVSITAYCEKNVSLDYLSVTDNITFVPAGDEHARIKKMLKDIFFWALENPKTSSVMVISDSIPDNVYEAIDALKSRGYNILLANPNNKGYADSVWLSTSLFGGENPIWPEVKESSNASIFRRGLMIPTK